MQHIRLPTSSQSLCRHLHPFTLQQVFRFPPMFYCLGVRGVEEQMGQSCDFSVPFKIADFFLNCWLWMCVTVSDG